MSAAAAEMELDRVECRRTTTTTTNNNNKRSTSKKQTHSPRPTTSSVSSSSPDRHHRAIHETRAANATTTRKRGLFPRLKGAILQKTTGSHNPRRRSESVITSTTFHAITGTANENDETDSLGDHILALLIQREAELYQAASSSNRHIARNNNNCHNHNIFRWKPILSHHNWTVLCHKLYHLQQQLLQLQQARGDDDQNTNKQWNISGAFFECIQRLASMAVNQHRPNLVWSTLLFLLRAAVVALLAVALGGTALLLGGGVVLVRGGSCICSILVDWDALLAHSKVASRLWRLLQDSGRTCYSFLDSVVLQGYRYQGREWNRGEFLFQHKINPNGSAAVSSFSTQLNRNASLWDLPPPSSISLSTAKTALSWSSRSRQHIEAIEYCYSMLQQEAMHHQQQQTRKDTRKNSIIGKNIKQQQHHQHALLAPFAKHKGCRRGSTDLVTHTKQTAWNDTQSDVLLSNKRDRFVENDDSDDNEGDVLSRGSGEGVVDDGDMDWIDVGTKIGMRFLHSEQIHRAMASKETKERLLESMTKIDGSSFNESNHSPDITDSVTEETVAHESTINLSKPVHSMWSSPVAAAADISTLSAQDVAGQLLEEFPSPFIEASQKQNSQLNVSPKLGCTSILSQTGNADSFVSTSELDLANDVAERVASLRPQLCDKANTNKVTAEIPSHRSRADLGSVFRRTPLQPGVKVAIPISPLQPCKGISNRRTSYQMASVIRSSRVYICEENEVNHNLRLETNCLSVTVKLEKFFLRNGEFGELTFRVMDAWSQRYMPRHSKVPIGSCIATSYGIGVLVGWRVEDDCHVVRSLWHCRGPGSAHSFLNRDAIHSTSAAALGFRVQTMFGWGVVLACVNGGMTFENCRFFVEIREDGRHKGNVLELEQKEILSCHGAQFLPVTEHIRAAAQYQIEVDNYVAAWREQLLNEGAPTVEQEFLYTWSSWADILWQGFLKAIEEDKDFDDGMNAFITSIINFLDRLDRIDDENNPEDVAAVRNVSMECADGIEVQLETDPTLNCDKNQEPGFWIMNDLFGGVFKANDEMREHHGVESSKSIEETHMISEENKSYFDRAFAVLRILMKTVSIARASSVKHPHFRLALAVFYDFLLFLRTIVKIQQRNTSIHSLKVWKRAWEEITSTFGPIKDRLESLGRGIARRMEQQGRKAKVRVLKFADKILGDERLLFALEQAEWDKCLARLEIALVEADIIEEPNLFYYRKAAKFLYDHAQMALGVDGGAATRSTEKLAIFAYLVQSMASPRRSFLKVFCRDDVLECFERILVRAYYKEEVATRMLTIHAANFQTLRHLRILKDFSVSGRIWIPLLDAADEELSWLVSTLPENSKGIMCPLSSLFSLCVAQFHKINAGDYSRDWLSFLLEDDSVRIIQDIDMLLTLALEAFSRDIREMMTVLPYYPR